MTKLGKFIFVSLVIVSGSANAAEVIFDDLIVNGSSCVGPTCQNGEEFDFDTFLIKSDTPIIEFMDTSNSADFPTIDWSIWLDDSDSTQASFIITERESGLNALVLQPGENGGVALGVGSEVIAGAVSVGVEGQERQIINVAEGTEDNDAVTLSQLNLFKDETLQLVAPLAAEIELEIDANNDRMDSINDRVDEVNVRMDEVNDRMDTIAGRLDELLVRIEAITP